MRTLIEKRGVLVKRLHNEDDLRSAVQMWNEKNENLGEFSIVLQKNYPKFYRLFLTKSAFLWGKL